MASDGSVKIDTLVDTKGFGKGLNTMKKQIGGFSSAIGKLGVTIAATFAVGKLIQFGKAAIDLGSDLQEVQNVVDVTFTTMSDKVNEFSKGAAEAAGLSETMAKRYVGTFGAMAKAFGFAENESYNMATALTQLAGDVASFYNLTQDEAYTKLKSVFTGETESLKDLGVVMTQTALDSFAMAKGWGKTTAAMNENEKVALRFAFVTEQLNAASGDFVRTQDSWANQTRILSLNFNSFKANIGQALINIFTPFLKVINQIVSKMAELSQRFVAFSELLVGKSTSGGGGSPGDALADIESGYDDIADATDKATKSQKNYTNGLDELNIISQNEESGIADGGISFSPIQNPTENEGLVETISLFDILQEKIEEFASRFTFVGNIINTFSNNIQLAKEMAQDLFTLLTKPFVDNKDGFLQASGNIATFLLSIFTKATEGIQAFSEKVLAIYNTRIAPIISKITGDISELVNKFLTWFNEDMGPVLDGWGKSFSEIWDEHIDPLWQNLAEFFAEVMENIGYLWDKTLKPFVEWIIDNVLPVITPIIKSVGNIFMRVFGAIGDIINFVIDILSGLITFITGVFTLDWKKTWTGICEIFTGIINTVISVVDFLINSFIDLINGLIGGVNKITGTIGIPPIPEIPNFEIPQLARGAVIPPNAPFVAMLGDQRNGKNLEAPEDLIRQIVREEAGGGKELIPYLEELIRYSKETAEKDLTIGDRAIAKANARGMRSMGYQLLTEE